VQAQGLDFILVCQPDSHPVTAKWVANRQRTGAIGTVIRTPCTGKRHETDTYRYAAAIPLRGADDALKVHGCPQQGQKQGDCQNENCRLDRASLQAQPAPPRRTPVRPSPSMESLLAIFVLLLIGWYWLDSLRARELALGICRAACEERELQFLGQTVALRRLRVRWTTEGLRLRRTYRFEFSEEGSDVRTVI
jgi:hypothetical protein